MNKYFNSQSLEERVRVNSLEPFDEFEEMEQKFGHYVLFYAASKLFQSFIEQIIPEYKTPMMYSDLNLELSAVQLTPFSKFLSRYICSFFPCIF